MTDVSAPAVEGRALGDGESTSTATATATSKAPAALVPPAAPDPAVPPGHELVEEGSARMIYPKSANSVFYNPVQVQNRDLSVFMINLFVERRARRDASQARYKELARADRGDDRSRDIDTRALRERAEKEMSERDWREEVAKISSSGGTVEGAGAAAGVTGVRILDALAASGLRSIRYWNEISGVREVVINDLEESAVDLAKENVRFNGLGEVLLDADAGAGSDSSPRGGKAAPRKSGIRVQRGDATHEMYVSRRPSGLLQLTPTQELQRERYDVIDLDPYGSAAPFIDGAVQAVNSGGMLCVTCTDMKALGGSQPETCYGRYGSAPIPRAGYLQEMALRILLGTLATAAARYGRTIRPVLSVGMAFYVRVFVEVYDDGAGVSRLSLDVGSVYQSTQCPSFYVAPHGQQKAGNQNVYQPARAPPAPQCEETGAPFKVGGPAWLGPLHDKAVVDKAVRRLENMPKEKKGEGSGSGSKPTELKTRERLHGLLTSVSEELPDVPLYYLLPDLCHTVHCQSPPMAKVRAALVNAGYRVSGYHKDPQAIKTDAPNGVVWDVMRAWCKEHPPKAGGSKKALKKKLRREQKKKFAEERKGGNGEKSGKKDEGGGGESKPEGDGDGDNGKDDAEAATAAAAADGDKQLQEEVVGEKSAPPVEGAAKEKERLSPGDKILAREMTAKIDFAPAPKGGSSSSSSGNRRRKATRFPHNPEANWGPKPAAKKSGGTSSLKRRAVKSDDVAVGGDKRGEGPNLKRVKADENGDGS